MTIIIIIITILILLYDLLLSLLRIENCYRVQILFVVIFRKKEVFVLKTETFFHINRRDCLLESSRRNILWEM